MNEPPLDNDQVRELFHQALERTPEEREDFLAHSCADDPARRQALESLLALHCEAARVFADPGAPDTEAPGDALGRYHLLQKLGEGGFGTVWLAEQEAPLRRKVALKVLKPGLDTQQVIRRFEAERQALALMDHPHIAKVFDGGTTPRGRPFFVMELIDGVPVTRYCDDAGLGVTERLQLFVSICQAVQHAHQKGVIHRDLKPSNVLVTLQEGRPVPKVIDFGIAKATAGQLSEHSVLTELRQMLGTPEYMAPEQAEIAGQDVDTRADIYSLGVLLYELLTGTRPFELKTLLQAGYAEMLRTIKEVDPPKPSTRVSSLGEQGLAIARQRRVHPRSLTSLVRGDLDWIVMKALEKERGRRYETATALADDVLRHLRHEPLLAGPPSRIYRLRKYVRRHRVGVTAGAAILLAILGGAAAAVWGRIESQEQARIAGEERGAAVTARGEERRQKELAIREQRAAEVARQDAETQRNAAQAAEIVAKEQRQRAEDRAAEARREAAKSRHLVELLQRMLASSNPHQRKGKDYTVRELLDDFARQLPRGLDREPEVKLVLLQTLASSYLWLGMPEKAAPHVETVTQLSGNLYSPDRAEHAECEALRARHLADCGQYEDAAAVYTTLLAEHGRRLPVETTDDWRLYLANCTRQLGRHDRAIRMLESLEVQVRERDGDPQPWLARVQQFLSVALMDRRNPGDLERAERMARAVVAAHRELTPEGSDELTASLNNLATVLQYAGRLGEACEAFEEVLRRDIAYYGPNHASVATSKASLAETLRLAGQPVRAESLAHEAVLALRRQPGDPLILARALNALGNARFAQAKTAAAVEVWSEALAIRERELGDHDTTANSLQNVALARSSLGQTVAATALQEQALAMRLRLHEPSHPSVATAQCGLGAVLMDTDPGRATGCFASACAIWRATQPVPERDLASATFNLGECLIRTGRFAAGAALLEEALPRYRASYHGAELARALAMIAQARWQSGALAASEAAQVEAIGIYTESAGAAADATIQAKVSLVEVLLEQGPSRAADAETLTSRMLELARRPDQPQPDQAALSLALRCRSRLLAGRPEAAAADLAEAQAIASGAAPSSPAMAFALVHCGELLLACNRATAAESVLRAAIGISAAQPAASRLQLHATSLRGQALHALGQSAAAEPLLLAAAEQFLAIPYLPLPASRWRRQAVERLITCYERQGKQDMVLGWRQRLATVDGSR